MSDAAARGCEGCNSGARVADAVEAPHSQDDPLSSLKKARNSAPDAGTAQQLRDRHRESIAQALDSRGDPFARGDRIRLQPTDSVGPAFSVSCRELPVTVGRAALEALFGAAVGGVSQNHFELYRNGALAHVRDLNSKNGTHLNGRAIRDEALCEGDILTVGLLDLRVFRD